jgi:hypothetical protein
MVESIGLHVEVLGDAIVVTMPGTSFSVTYRKSADSPSLIASDSMYPRVKMDKRADFLARSCRIANDKARELGWIV